jgi:hypothetical protein
MPTPSEIERMRSLRQQDWSYRRIADTLKIPYSKVIELIKDGRNLGRSTPVPKNLKVRLYQQATGGKAATTARNQFCNNSGEAHHWVYPLQDGSFDKQAAQCQRCEERREFNPYGGGDGFWDTRSDYNDTEMEEISDA